MNYLSFSSDLLLGKREGISSQQRSYHFELTNGGQPGEASRTPAPETEGGGGGPRGLACRGGSPATEGGDRVHAGDIHFLILGSVSPWRRDTAQV